MDIESVKLYIKPWGDGTSEQGTVNVFSPSLGLVVAKDVEKEIAIEMCCRWNNYIAEERHQEPKRLPKLIRNIFTNAIGPEWKIEDVAQMSDDELKALPLMGRISFSRVKDWLNVHHERKP